MQDMVDGGVAHPQGLWLVQTNTADHQSANGRGQPGGNPDAVKEPG